MSIYIVHHNQNF